MSWNEPILQIAINNLNITEFNLIAITWILNDINLMLISSSVDLAGFLRDSYGILCWFPVEIEIVWFFAGQFHDSWEDSRGILTGLSDINSRGPARVVSVIESRRLFAFPIFF